MIIDTISDIFITGHMHRSVCGIYKNVNIINSSTWSDVTDFQEKLGIVPQVARVPILNLKTRKSKIYLFD